MWLTAGGACNKRIGPWQCVAIPAAGEAASPAQHREAVLLRKGGFEARRVWRVMVAEHRCFTGSSLGTCTLLVC